MRSGTLECSLIEDDLVGGSRPYDRLDTRRRALFHRRPVIADFAVRGENDCAGRGRKPAENRTELHADQALEIVGRCPVRETRGSRDVNKTSEKRSGT